MNREAAFSGLEAAIVLIAFVVVAAVFSYVMLGAGFFATQKAQETTYSGIKQTTSNLVLDGYLWASESTFEALTFYVKVPEAGEAQQLSKTSILYSRGGAVGSSKTFTPASGILKAGERTKIHLVLGSSTGPGSSFTVEIKPQTGASSIVQRTLASGFSGGVIF
jgi:archaeal flagellin FlaB